MQSSAAINLMRDQIKKVHAITDKPFGMGISFIHKIEPAANVVDRLYAGVPKDQR